MGLAADCMPRAFRFNVRFLCLAQERMLHFQLFVWVGSSSDNITLQYIRLADMMMHDRRSPNGPCIQECFVNFTDGKI